MKTKNITKTVQSVEEVGFIGKLRGLFSKKTTKTVVKTRKISITKTGKHRKEYSHVTIEQVRKLFRLKKDNPNLSNCDISKAVGISEVLVRYYLNKGKTASIKDFKAKEKRHKPKEPKKTKPKKNDYPYLYESKVAEVVKTKTKKSDLIVDVGDQKLNELYKTEKYPVEHQSDPKYFAESQPPHSVATVEAFKKQKRKNNINRAVVAKKLGLDRKLDQERETDSLRKNRLRLKHLTNEPKIHFDTCPSCNEKSKMTVDSYNFLVKQEAWRRKQWADKQTKLMEKEKQIDQSKQEPTVAELTREGTKLCKTCDSRIPYSQATRSMQVYGEHYCADCQPKL